MGKKNLVVKGLGKILVFPYSTNFFMYKLYLKILYGEYSLVFFKMKNVEHVSYSFMVS